MLVGVENLTKDILKAYGFKQIIHDHGLRIEDVLQILVDHGYIDTTVYEEALNDK